MKRALIVEIICFLFILLFVYAALMKLLDVEKFTVQLGQSPLLMAFAPVVAWAVPFTELAISVLLIFSGTHMIGLIASFTMMSAFTIYITVILSFTQRIPCSCGGILEDMTWVQHLTFNIGFVLIAITGIALLDKERKANTLSNQKMSCV